MLIEDEADVLADRQAVEERRALEHLRRPGVEGKGRERGGGRSRGGRAPEVAEAAREWGRGADGGARHADAQLPRGVVHHEPLAGLAADDHLPLATANAAIAKERPPSRRIEAADRGVGARGKEQGRRAGGAVRAAFRAARREGGGAPCRARGAQP